MTFGGSTEFTARLHWRKSSYSAGDGGECVEVAPTPMSVYVRDSKDRERPSLTVGRAQWTAFIRFASR
ncbi:DUF397 domain-containing protein [Streptomyces marispadix]|uniref:DUF397 domain-containing protein n=1 Tax=Streptomyces marispadix TaxID=2922868 RepID=A0ABS9T5A5_9ACTN|nr:DUF397 domain-containing protein [Streptomyces marispadix]MCH6163690.1 DUF397 domain-containing protein [Streptomyces marispadix]